MAEAWRGFKKDGHWDVDVNVRNFIQTNYTPDVYKRQQQIRLPPPQRSHLW